MNLLQRTPFFRLLLALVFGIVIFQYFRVPEFVLFAALITTVLILASFLLIRNADFLYRFRWLFGVNVMICFACIGYSSCLHFDKNNQFTELNHRAIYEVELITAPVEKARSYSFRVKLLHRYDSTESTKVGGKAILYLQKDSIPLDLLLGDRLLVDAEFKIPDGAQNPNGFDYAAYLKRQGIGATTYLSSDKWKKIGRNPDFLLHRFANQSRNFLLEIYKKYGVDGSEFAVLAALTLGYTDSLDPELYKLYSHTGAVHILSVSGLHVGIVYGAIMFLLQFLGKTRRQIIFKAIISILFIWAYAIITGLSPAVMRAALMMSIIALATCTNRRPQIYNTVLSSAFILLILNPNLLYNIGFQLSYSAVLSIVAFQKSIYQYWTPTNKFLKAFWSLTSVSLAAQLGTAPISIYYFSQFPNYFLLTNYAAIPLSTGIIYLAIVLLFVSFIPLLAGWTGFVLKWLTWLMNKSLEVIVMLPGSISTISISDFQLFYIMAAILLFITFAFNKRYFSLISGLVFVLLFVGSFAVRHYQSYQNSKMIVFSDSRSHIINFIDGKKNFVFTNDELQAYNTADAFWRSSLLKKPEFLSQNSWFEDGFAVFRGKKILILKDDLLRNKTAENPIEIDYLILTNRLKPRMQEILEIVKPKKVVADKTISPWYTNHVKETCETMGIDFYSVAEKGAFVEHLD